MRYLKTTKDSPEYNELNGLRDGNNQIQLIEDNDGNYFIHEGIKRSLFSNKISAFNKMEEVEEITIKDYDNNDVRKPQGKRI